MNSCFTKQYGKLFMEIPVAITIENKTLNAKLSISDTDYGLICLTYQISAFVYAIALIVYGSKYSSKILSFVSSNAKTNEAKWDSNTKWCFPRGKHLDGTYRLSKPDTDNLQKLLKDCMTKVGFWDDDALVASEIVEKFWAEVPGIYVRIDRLP